MLPVPFKVVLDANVLFPFSLRDTLLRAAARGFFQIHWSEEILEETRRNLIRTNTVLPEQADRLVATMKKAFPEAMVSGHEPLIPAMRNDEGAAAVKCGAQVIVTNNLRDFRDLPVDIEAQSPDEFLGNLLDLDAEAMLELLREQAAALKKPTRSLDELLQGLAKVVPGFISSVRHELDAEP